MLTAMHPTEILQSLVAKRLALLGELQRLEAETTALRVDLAHLDGSITVFMRGANDASPSCRKL